jgi:hypothetical protein
MMATYFEVIKEYFPNVTAEEAEHILWEHTGYPGFWAIPSDGNTPEECLRKQLQELRGSE